jgi:hypothetical protein
MAPRKKKKDIGDIVGDVGGWLGGNRGTINPQVARVSRDLGTVAQTIDTFTGGLGAAAGRDARNFQQGGSLPTNLAKTAAVNLAAGAVGAKAAQVARGCYLVFVLFAVCLLQRNKSKSIWRSWKSITLGKI